MACSDELVIPEEFAREIHTEKMRKALLVVVQALEAKNKSSGESMVEIDDKNQTERSVEALVEALGKEAEDKTERSFVDRFFDEFEFVDLLEDTVLDEDLIKEVAELQKMWRFDCADAAPEAFSDPSHPRCLVACD